MKRSAVQLEEIVSLFYETGLNRHRDRYYKIVMGRPVLKDIYTRWQASETFSSDDEVKVFKEYKKTGGSVEVALFILDLFFPWLARLCLSVIALYAREAKEYIEKIIERSFPETIESIPKVFFSGFEENFKTYLDIAVNFSNSLEEQVNYLKKIVSVCFAGSQLVSVVFKMLVEMKKIYPTTQIRIQELGKRLRKDVDDEYLVRFETTKYLYKAGSALNADEKKLLLYLVSLLLIELRVYVWLTALPPWTYNNLEKEMEEFIQKGMKNETHKPGWMWMIGEQDFKSFFDSSVMSMFSLKDNVLDTKGFFAFLRSAPLFSQIRNIAIEEARKESEAERKDYRWKNDVGEVLTREQTEKSQMPENMTEDLRSQTEKIIRSATEKEKRDRDKIRIGKVAEMLDISKPTLRKYMRKGEIAPEKGYICRDDYEKLTQIRDVAKYHSKRGYVTRSLVIQQLLTELGKSDLIKQKGEGYKREKDKYKKCIGRLEKKHPELKPKVCKGIKYYTIRKAKKLIHLLLPEE